MRGLLAQTLAGIRPVDSIRMEKAQARQNELTKPHGSLGRLEELSIKLAGIKPGFSPRIVHKAIITMVADHGVVAEGISAYPQEVTAQMVNNFLRGGAAINVLSRLVGARMIVVDMGVAAELAPHPNLLSKKIGFGTRNMAKEPAMTSREAKRAIETGIEIVETRIDKGLDILGTGDMGIGNTTSSSAICTVMTGKSVALVTGRGTGIDDKQLVHKIAVIQKAITVNQPDAKDPLDVLAKIGGFEIGGLVGVMLGAAAHHIPVVLDGFISGTAALIATALAPNLKDYLIAAHISVEPGHKVLLEYLGLSPLLDLGMRLGEGTGATLGIFLCEASVRILNEMATFGEAGVSQRSKDR